MVGVCVTKGLWAHNPNLANLHTALTWKVIISSGHNFACHNSSAAMMIRSDHNFAHVTTAELSWHVQNCDPIGSSESESTQREFQQDFFFFTRRFQLWAHKPFGKWLPGLCIGPILTLNFGPILATQCLLCYDILMAYCQTAVSPVH